MNKKILLFVFLYLVTLSALIEVVHAENSFNDAIDKIDKFKSNQNKVYYDKVQPLNNQYCFIKVVTKQENDKIVKQEVVECADGRKAYDGPSYWELFAQFYYGDMTTPAYCRYYERPAHAYHKPGKVCLDKNGNWQVRK